MGPGVLVVGLTNPPLPEVRVRAPFRMPFLLLMICVVTLAAGCAKRPEPLTQVRIVVLDGRVDPSREETRRSTAGYLLSDRNRFDDGNAGRHFADALALEIDKIRGVRVHPRVDVNAMMSQKERLLAELEPGLTADERYDFLLSLDPIDYGRELNADFVVVPYMSEARMIQNRAIYWWYSKVAGEVQMWDVDRGVMVDRWSGRHTGYFRSQRWVMEDLAKRARRALARKNTMGVEG